MFSYYFNKNKGINFYSELFFQVKNFAVRKFCGSNLFKPIKLDAYLLNPITRGARLETQNSVYRTYGNNGK